MSSIDFVWVDGDEVHRARAAAADISEVVLRLVTDQPGIVGHQRACAGGNVAPAFRLIGLGEEIQPVGRVGVFLEVEIELGMALVVGLAVLELRRIALLGVAQVVEVLVAQARKAGKVGLRVSDASTRRLAAGVPNRLRASTMPFSPAGFTQHVGEMSRKRRVHTFIVSGRNSFTETVVEPMEVSSLSLPTM